MRRILFLFFVGLLSLSAMAADYGGWKYYLAYTDAYSCVPVGKTIYGNFAGNVLSYQLEDGEVRFLSKESGLNGQNVIFMDYSKSEQCLVLVYSDLMVDLYYPDEDNVVPIPQFKNSDLDGLELHHLFIDGEKALLSFNQGLAWVDLEERSVIGFYKFDGGVQAAAYYNNQLYAATSEKLYTCAADGNPLDQNEWKVVSSASIKNFFVWNGSLLAAANKNVDGGLTTGLWMMNADGATFQLVSGMDFTYIATNSQHMVTSNGYYLFIYDQDSPTAFSQRIIHPHSWYGMSLSEDGTLWASDSFNGIQAYQIREDSLQIQGEAIGNYGPKRDLCYYMKYAGNRLLIAGGRLDPMDSEHYRGTLMELTDGKWKTFQEDGIREETGVPYIDINSLAVDPKDENHIFASAGGTGLYEFQDYKFKSHISNHNSPLQSAAGASPLYVRMDGLNYDSQGNLWMVNNSQQDTILRVLRPDGTWKGFYIEGLVNAPTCEKTLFDQKGRLWVASRRTVGNHDGGLLCLDYKGTVDATSDDVSTYRSVFVNQDGKSYTVGGVYCMAEDKNGAIWVGTRAGLFVVNDPDNWHSSNYRVTQVKVPRNDGTNLADYLLADMIITAIAVDGADRKWIAVEGGGLYLVSPDGTKILEHFDESNSMLLSNSIYSLAPNLETGEIMIGTSKGICSYQSSATTPVPSLNKGNIKVYPNPVRPEYNGNLTVQGLTENAEVKIMTTSGEVVAHGYSTGGTFVWNVRGADGARVPAGIYYLMIATADGEKGVAAKFVVI